MPTFRFPDDFKDHKSYVLLLKKALQQVKGETSKKFLYFKQYSFGPKKLPLVLVDYDPNCVGVLNKAGLKPTDEGMVSLTPQDELNFVPKRDALKRIRLRKYFATMGGGIKPVFVPPGEVDEEEDEAKEVSTESRGESEGTAPPPPVETPPVVKPPQAEVPPESEPPAPLDKRMEKKLAHEENEFKRRQLQARIEELKSAPIPASLEALKKQVLDKAQSLSAENRFADAEKLLGQLGARLKTLPVRPPPPSTPPTEPPPMSKAMEQKMAFEESEFQRRQLNTRLQNLEKQIGAAADATRKQQMEEVRAALGKNEFEAAGKLLDQLEASQKTLPSRPPPPTTPPPKTSPPTDPQPEVPKERKLSTYMNLNAEWDKARKTAAAELQRMEKVIAAACEGEPVKDAVFKKLPQLHTLVLKLDSRLSDALSAGAKATDPDKQLDLDKQTRKVLGEYRGVLQGHPLANVVDENPFGSFNVMKGLDVALSRIEAEFN